MPPLNARLFRKAKWHLAGLSLICFCWPGHPQNGQDQGDPVSQVISYLTSSQPEVQLAAAEALGKIGDPRGVEPLVATLKGPDPYLRQSAARALGLIGDLRAVEPLTAATNDSDPSVRRWATASLAEINSPEAAEHRRLALQDPVEASTAHLKEAETYLQVVRQKETEALTRAAKAKIVDANIRALNQSGANGPVDAARQKEAAMKNMPGTAMVYVYRPERARKGDWPGIYLNGESLTVFLYASSYAFQAVPPGKVVVTSDLSPPSRTGPSGSWASLPGCASLDLEQIYMAGGAGWWGQVQAPKCQDSLRETMTRMRIAPANNLPYDLVNLCGLRTEAAQTNITGREIITKTAGIDPGEWATCYRGFATVLAVLNRTAVPTRIEFDVAAGKSYYVRWSVKSGGKLELVDATAGAKELQPLSILWY